MDITTAELHRKYFKELLKDGESHKLNEICAYAAQRMQEEGYYNRPCSANRVQLSLIPLFRQANCGYGKPSHGFYQKNFQDLITTVTTPMPDKWSVILDKLAELRDEMEAIFSKEIPLENPSEEAIECYKSIGQKVVESSDLMLDHYSVWLAAMEDHQLNMEQEMTMKMTM